MLSINRKRNKMKPHCKCLGIEDSLIWAWIKIIGRTRDTRSHSRRIYYRAIFLRLSLIISQTTGGNASCSSRLWLFLGAKANFDFYLKVKGELTSISRGWRAEGILFFWKKNKDWSHTIEQLEESASLRARRGILPRGRDRISLNKERGIF